MDAVTTSHAKVSVRKRLRTIEDIDQRSRAYRRAKELIDAIKEDLGHDEFTVSQRQLIQHAAILGAMIEDLGAKWLLGEKIDQANYALLINAQRRVLSQL